MGYLRAVLGRLWTFVALLIAGAIGYFLANNLGMGENWGYGVGCLLGVVVWAIGASALGTLGRGKNVGLTVRAPLLTH